MGARDGTGARDGSLGTGREPGMEQGRGTEASDGSQGREHGWRGDRVGRVRTVGSGQGESVSPPSAGEAFLVLRYAVGVSADGVSADVLILVGSRRGSAQYRAVFLPGLCGWESAARRCLSALCLCLSGPAVSRVACGQAPRLAGPPRRGLRHPSRLHLPPSPPARPLTLSRPQRAECAVLLCARATGHGGRIGTPGARRGRGAYLRRGLHRAVAMRL